MGVGKARRYGSLRARGQGGRLCEQLRGERRAGRPAGAEPARLREPGLRGAVRGGGWAARSRACPCASASLRSQETQPPRPAPKSAAQGGRGEWSRGPAGGGDRLCAGRALWHKPRGPGGRVNPGPWRPTKGQRGGQGAERTHELRASAGRADHSRCASTTPLRSRLLPHRSPFPPQRWRPWRYQGSLLQEGRLACSLLQEDFSPGAEMGAGVTWPA